MTRQTSTHFVLSLAVLGLMLSTSPCLAQGKPAIMHHQPLPASQKTTQTNGAVPAGSPSYTFTILAFPGSFSTNIGGINSGAASSKIEIVGAYDWAPEDYTGSFDLYYTVKKGPTTETFRSVNKPTAIYQGATNVNDAGEIVGYYVDSGTVYHGYLKKGGKFTTIDVPFAGAVNTWAKGINNSGEIVGTWEDAITDHGFVLSGGTYTSFDYPGAVDMFVYCVNNNGVIVGAYTDASGVSHGFSLSAGTFASYDPPGSTYTAGGGINDSGDIVGFYCLTSECAEGSNTPQGFLLSGGTYTTIAIPGATGTWANAINNNGAIVGSYADGVGGAYGSNGFLATPQ